MKGMAWGAPKGSPRMSSNPRPLSWIVVSVGALAIFLFYASWVLLSHPIGTTVQGYFYSVDSTGKLDVSTTQTNEDSIDAPLNKSPDLVDDKPSSSDLQSSTILSGVTSDSKIEQTHSNSNSEVGTSDPNSEKSPITKEQVDPSEPTSEKSPITKEQVDLSNPSSEKSPFYKEVSGLENSDGGASRSRDATSSFENSVDAVNSSLPTQPNSQINLISTETMPVASNNAFNVTSDMRMDEPTSVVLNNQSSETSKSSGDLTSTAVPALVEKPDSTPSSGPVNSGCDLYHGSWIHDPLGPLYTNNTCPVITQMQNCQGNGRPDQDYENWRWKPSQCDLPRFDPRKFLELMRGKTLAFIGDSVARNQMESLLCILWQVEAPKNRGNRNMQRYYFRSASVMIVRIWSSWLVKLTSEPFDYAEAGVDKLHLDAPDPKLMEYLPTFDVVVLSSGHWFAKKSVYILNNEIVGGQLWWPDNSRKTKINSIEAYGISVETTLSAIAAHPNFTGITIVRSYSPDHYEGGAWNTGGSCTGKVKPIELGKLVENGHTNDMHRQQVNGFHRALKKTTSSRSKLRLMDITEIFQYRHDGHPGPYRSPDPNKITKRGPDGRPPPQDCLHWCMPGPVDTWNEFVFEIIRREYEGSSAS